MLLVVKEKDGILYVQDPNKQGYSRRNTGIMMGLGIIGYGSIDENGTLSVDWCGYPIQHPIFVRSSCLYDPWDP
jgi:hypothetical protein